MVYEVTVSSKGQLVIPAPLRHRLKLVPGTRVRLTQKRRQLVLEPEPRVDVEKYCGLFALRPGETPATAELLAERRRERAAEET